MRREQMLTRTATSPTRRAIRLGIGVGTLSLLLLTTAASANHIDFLTDAGFRLSTTAMDGPASASQTGDDGNVLGGERDVMLSLSGGSGVISADLLVADGPGEVGPDVGESLLLSNSVGASGLFELVYDGVGTSGLGGLDFDTMWNFIGVSFDSVQGSGDLTVEVEDLAGAVGSSTQTVDMAGVFSFGFGDDSLSLVDFTQIQRVRVALQTTEDASDFSLTQITREVVPEPATGLLMGLGLGGLAVAGRRSVATRP